MTTQVKILQQLKHPNVILFHGVVSDVHGIYYIVTGRCLCLIDVRLTKEESYMAAYGDTVDQEISC